MGLTSGGSRAHVQVGKNSPGLTSRRGKSKVHIKVGSHSDRGGRAHIYVYRWKLSRAHIKIGEIQGSHPKGGGSELTYRWERANST